jgi:hypothetical protein
MLIRLPDIRWIRAVDYAISGADWHYAFSKTRVETDQISPQIPLPERSCPDQAFTLKNQALISMQHIFGFVIAYCHGKQGSKVPSE